MSEIEYAPDFDTMEEIDAWIAESLKAGYSVYIDKRLFRIKKTDERNDR